MTTRPLDVSPLFETLVIGDKTLHNRIVMPPMVVCRGTGTPEAVEWYGRHARGGVGLVIIEATAVNRFGDDLTAERLRPQVDAIHNGGALAAIQLFPTTRGSNRSPVNLGGDEIDAMIEHYATATEVCCEAGFDGIEPHGAHGYLLNQFFSPLQNERDDAYGGQRLQTRMRLALDIVETVRPLCGDMLLLYRHTPVGQGYGIQDSLALGRALAGSGVDILDLSPSSVGRPGDRAAPFRPIGIPLIAVGGLDDPERALEVLNEDRADLVAVGRGLIADPDWPIKVREERFDEITPCVQCGGCHEDLRENLPVGCTQWA